MKTSMFKVQHSAFGVRPLPRYISAHRDIFNVRIRRHGVQYQAYVPTLERALQVRDQFLAQVGERTSNTGITGISESVQWSRNCRQPIYSVSLGHHRSRKFYVKQYGGRRPALRAAAAFRSRLTGQPITDNQIEEALNHV